MKNETVKYNNEMNKISFRKFKQADLNIFMKIVVAVCEKGTDMIEIPFSEIREDIEYIGKKGQFVEVLLNFCIKISGIIAKDIDGVWMCVSLFSRMKPIESREVLQIKVNKDNIHYFNDLKNVFTSFGFQDFIKLESKYAKNLFRLIMQWKSKGHCPTEHEDKFFTVEEIKKYLDTPDYNPRELKRFVLDIAVAEINEKGVLKNLVLNVHNAKKRGAPVVGYSFNFDKIKSETKAIEDKNKQKPTDKKQKLNNKFNDFSQKQDYDIDELEKQILSN